jgi:hypothetical protein
MIRRSAASLLAFFLFAAASPASAEEDNAPMPQKLVIGNEDEGKVDASAGSCRAFVTETVEWE